MDGLAVSGRDLGAEWARIELLGQCLLRARRGEEVSDALLADLEEANKLVRRGRSREGPWTAVAADFESIHFDVLACVVAPEAEPLRPVVRARAPVAASVAMI